MDKNEILQYTPECPSMFRKFLKVGLIIDVFILFILFILFSLGSIYINFFYFSLLFSLMILVTLSWSDWRSKLANKERYFYNSLVVISQEFLKDIKVQKFDYYAIKAASIIIEDRFKEYNEDTWELIREHGPSSWSLSRGDRIIYDFAANVTDEQIELSKKRYNKFQEHRVNELRKKATLFLKAEEQRFLREIKMREINWRLDELDSL